MKYLNFRNILFLFYIVCFSSCSKSKLVDLDKLNGYWEIYQVKKDGEIIREYTINSSLDYFYIEKDSTGYRKKVVPQVDGTFRVSNNSLDFKAFLNNNSIEIDYENEKLKTNEPILLLTENELEIQNNAGLLFSYKRFKKLGLISEQTKK